MRQWKSSLQQITHIRGRKGRQNLEFQLMKQFWVPLCANISDTTLLNNLG